MAYELAFGCNQFDINNVIYRVYLRSRNNQLILILIGLKICSSDEYYKRDTKCI